MYGVDNRWKHLSEKPTSRWMLPEIAARQADRLALGIRLVIISAKAYKGSSDFDLKICLFLLNKQKKLINLI